MITYIYRLNSSVTKRINYINATYENDKLYDLVFDRILNDNSKLILPESFGYIQMVGSLNLSKKTILNHYRTVLEILKLVKTYL